MRFRGGELMAVPFKGTLAPSRVLSNLIALPGEKETLRNGD